MVKLVYDVTMHILLTLKCPSDYKTNIIQGHGGESYCQQLYGNEHHRKS